MIGVFVALPPDNPSTRGDEVGYVIEESGCWKWVGYVNRGGYGMLKRDGKLMTAHCWMYQQQYGDVPSSLDLDHFRCSNRQCVNPEHLRPVDHRENLLRGDTIVAHAATKTHCKRGHLLSGNNLCQSGLRDGKRQCRICRNLRTRERRAHGRINP